MPRPGRFSDSLAGAATGWLKVEANSSAINGYVEYGTATSHALVTAQLNASQLSMFSHQANAPLITRAGDPQSGHPDDKCGDFFDHR